MSIRNVRVFGDREHQCSGEPGQQGGCLRPRSFRAVRRRLVAQGTRPLLCQARTCSGSSMRARSQQARARSCSPGQAITSPFLFWPAFASLGEHLIKAGERFAAVTGFDENKPFPSSENRVVGGEFENFIITDERSVVVTSAAESLTSELPYPGTLFSCRHRTSGGDQSIRT